MKKEILQTPENETARVLNEAVLNFEEACKYLKVSKSFLYKCTSERTIPFYKPTGGKLLRFRKDDLDQWLARNRFASKEEIIKTTGGN